MRKLSALLAEGKGVVLDGALATNLETLGADISSALWSASLLQTNPSLIRQTHASYFAHGSQVATTASYQASIPGLAKHLSISEEEATKYVQKSVALAQEARDEYLSPASDKRQEAQRLLIAGSVGPYGAYLADGSEYTGSYNLTVDQYHDFHRGRIAALLAAGVDVLAIETIPSITETRALVSLISTEYPEAEVWFTFTLSSPTCLSDGTPIADVMAALRPFPNVVAVGVNCVSPELALEGLKEFRKHTEKPLIAYPNSGEKWDAAKRDWHGGKAQGGELKQWVKDVWDVGARVIGGCCRTGPEDVAVVAETIRELSESV
ncbi:Homocysteine S-methyltransferase [Bimuria novae-zelandiae CBS 107.79]|uniref:Homocysteine S-methyltransferase n=1 Tax=Bimuria novae-zelandiae CBS 107.79 TaxID=1447943 RepID=A0A6A5VJL4_9PLEO|nr:Homocysteine S-methyltransferase [Bimuria novae-zelandiae CBS 107.79]